MGTSTDGKCSQRAQAARAGRSCPAACTCYVRPCGGNCPDQGGGELKPAEAPVSASEEPSKPSEPCPVSAEEPSKLEVVEEPAPPQLAMEGRRRPSSRKMMVPKVLDVILEQRPDGSGNSEREMKKKRKRNRGRRRSGLLAVLKLYILA
ncbi:hypothetical protein Cni_G22712 [Canna indica]|uniref:Uncharacterized protein n=1 Tax=Canna indica TaxID=4628 RepID=A0AAQ3KRR8_9LILI|nr:hypothetical protein Cni_G22712 [Canna indica]